MLTNSQALTVLASQRQTLTAVERDFREALRIAKAAGDRVGLPTVLGSHRFADVTIDKFTDSEFHYFDRYFGTVI